MAFLSMDEYVADGVTQQFDITFPYIATTHIKVYVDGVEDTTYTWVNPGRIELTAMPDANVRVIIERHTSRTSSLVDFTPGTLTEADLDTQRLQAFYMAQEAIDRANRSVLLGLPIGEPAAFLRWNLSATAIENADVAGLGAVGIPVPLSQGGTNATTAAGARTNLGVTLENAGASAFGAGVAAAADAAASRVALGVAGLAGTLVEFTTTGPYVKPANLDYVLLEGQAPGGGGGGAQSTAAGEQSNGGGGGGGGGFRKRINAASLAASETVTIGLAGTGISASAGNSGGSVSFGAHCSATGGRFGGTTTAGANPTSASGGAGGEGLGGDVNYAGNGGGYGVGGVGPNYRSSGGHGGGGALTGGGAAGRGNGSTGAVGFAAVGIGGGGSGACSSESGGVNRAGGDGGAGLIRVWEFYK